MSGGPRYQSSVQFFSMWFVTKRGTIRTQGVHARRYRGTLFRFFFSFFNYGGSLGTRVCNRYVQCHSPSSMSPEKWGALVARGLQTPLMLYGRREREREREREKGEEGEERERDRPPTPNAPQASKQEREKEKKKKKKTETERDRERAREHAWRRRARQGVPHLHIYIYIYTHTYTHVHGYASLPEGSLKRFKIPMRERYIPMYLSSA